MRDYIEHEFTMQMAYGRLTWLARLLRKRRVRKIGGRLRTLSDAELREIGISLTDRLI